MFVFYQSLSQAPNLVPNGSFEERVDCIWNHGDVEDAPPWFNPTAASPDVFHECAVVNEDPCPWPNQVDLDDWMYGTPTNARGCEVPYDGVGYADIFVYGPDFNDWNGYKEYLGVRLTNPLEAGMDYVVKFQASLAEKTGYAIWNIQVHFSPDSLTPMDTVSIAYNSYIDVEPQLTGTPGEFITNYDGWHEMAWNYTAAGGEQFMYIGSFEREEDMDALYVLPIDSFGVYYQFSCYYIDDVQVRKGTLSVDDGSQYIPFKTFPNPVSEQISIETAEPISHVEIFDSQGKSVLKQRIPEQTEFELDVSDLSKGIYFLHVRFMDNRQTNRKLVKR